jgi:hypothetical protein
MSDGVRWASRSSTGTVRIRKNEGRRFPPLFPLVGAHANNNCHEGRRELPRAGGSGL